MTETYFKFILFVRYSIRVSESVDCRLHEESINVSYIISVNSIKTFYEEDLQTSHFFNSDTRGKIDLCETLGRFYKIKSEYYSLTQYVRFKNSQMLYCHGDMETFQNYTK